MTHSAMTAQLGHEFDAFLFASVDQEINGGSLSVLSVLARANVDPWREAADLAGMPLEAANRRLTSLIGALPAESALPLVPAAIADRLVRLLPRGSSASVASRGRSLRTDPALHSRTMTNMLLINVFVMAGALFAQWALADLQPPHEGVVRTAASRTVPAQAPLVDPGIP
jgi:hypothetical protein